jgi:DNA-directed RNA polymerase specialized sigma24 family protein
MDLRITSNRKVNMNHHRTASLLCEFDASQRGEILSKVVQYIEQLPSIPKKVLAMYCYENLHPTEIAAWLGLTEDDRPNSCSDGKVAPNEALSRPRESDRPLKCTSYSIASSLVGRVTRDH